MLTDFVADKKEETEGEIEKRWESFFAEAESLRMLRNKDGIKDIKNKVNELSEKLTQLYSRIEIVGDFERHIKSIYTTWRKLFKRTFLLFFVFVIFAGVSLFISEMPWENYLGTWTEAVFTLIMLSGLILFLFWAYYFYSSIQYHYYGMVDDLLWASDAQAEKNLQAIFTKYEKRWIKTQELLKEILPQLLEQSYLFSYLYRSILFFKRIARSE